VSTAQARVRQQLAEGALAMLASRGPGWHAFDRGAAELIGFIRPRDLDP
jgi:hypothetical protein